jgi:hypothetical protein
MNKYGIRACWSPAQLLCGGEACSSGARHSCSIHTQRSSKQLQVQAAQQAFIGATAVDICGRVAAFDIQQAVNVQVYQPRLLKYSGSQAAPQTGDAVIGSRLQQHVYACSRLLAVKQYASSQHMQHRYASSIIWSEASRIAGRPLDKQYAVLLQQQSTRHAACNADEQQF